jgi:hypothetical protein
MQTVRNLNRRRAEPAASRQLVQRLGAWSPSVQAWNRWQQRDPALDQLNFAALRAEMADRSTPFDRRDELLAALVRLGRMDASARLAVVVLLLPGLLRAVERFGRCLDYDERWATIIAGLWDQLDRYDLDRRPHHIAANLLWDASGTVLRASRREEHVAEYRCRLDEATLPATMVGDADRDLLDPAVRAGVLTDVDAALILATRLSGLDLREAAVLFGISYEAAKKRRRRAEVAWASWWVPGWSPRGTTPARAEVA